LEYIYIKVVQCPTGSVPADVVIVKRDHSPCKFETIKHSLIELLNGLSVCKKEPILLHRMKISIKFGVHHTLNIRWHHCNINVMVMGLE